MYRQQYNLSWHWADEIIVDLFAGGGGMSTAMHLATGISPHIACNHDADAISMHEANHPQTRHYQADVYELDPHVVSWRADNHEEHILGAGQDESQAKVHASKTIMDLICSLKPVQSLEYMRYTSEKDDPHKHLEKLFAMHADQKASREES